MTSSELAFATALLTAAISALATLVTYKTARESSRDQRRNLELQLRHQRDVAADERIWAERRDVYVELLVWLQDLTDRLPDKEAFSRETWHRHRVMWARVAAFGSPRVQTLRDEAEAAMLAWRDASAKNTAVAEADAAGWAALRRVADEIRKELGAAG